jgi:hypothetical protein
LIGEMAERSKALDWNSSKPRKGFRGFESHSLRQIQKGLFVGPFEFGGGS